MAKIPDITVKVDAIEVSALQQLAEEFRRLAAEAYEKSNASHADLGLCAFFSGKWTGLEQAALMLEERLNG